MKVKNGYVAITSNSTFFYIPPVEGQPKVDKVEGQIKAAIQQVAPCTIVLIRPAWAYEIEAYQTVSI